MATAIQTPALLASVLLDALHRRDAGEIAAALEETRQLPQDLDPDTAERMELLQALAQDIGSEAITQQHRKLLQHLAAALLRGRYNAKSWHSSQGLGSCSP